jgi:hypothetical protein
LIGAAGDQKHRRVNPMDVGGYALAADQDRGRGSSKPDFVKRVDELGQLLRGRGIVSSGRLGSCMRSASSIS